MVRVQKNFVNPSRTKQAFKDECDINMIVKKFKKVNGVDFLDVYKSSPNTGFYGDFSDVGDYRTMFDRVNAARASFEALPAQVRKRFNHDAAFFLDFCLDPRNLDELVKLGLASKPLAQAPSESPSSELSGEK